MKKSRYIVLFSTLILLLGTQVSCSDSYLEEKPMDKFSPENLLTSKKGFETVIYSLHNFARSGLFQSNNEDVMNTGTDVACSGVTDGRFFNDYSLILPEHATPKFYWNWAYQKMLKDANLVVTRAENPNVSWTEDEKNAIVAEAKFFRAYTYNILVNLFGGVPIVDKEELSPRFDYTRASRKEVLEFIQKDLEFAAQYLPIVTSDASQDGRIFRAAANHLLSEVYISLGQETGDQSFYDKSIAAATAVIDGSCGEYALVKSRFGDTSRPGDYYSDLFWTNQQNRASGNKEGIWVVQFEYLTPGAEEANNAQLRLWGPKIEDVTYPDGKKILVCDTVGRMQGIIRPLNHANYEIWDDPNDMRYSPYNFKKDFYMNNPDSKYNGEKLVLTKKDDGKMYITLSDGTITDKSVDTFRVCYPYFRKIEGEMPWGAMAGRTPNDRYIMRLSETYLLRAEAYFQKGDLANAANDINVVRGRAQAKPVQPGQISLDYILDERMRELVVEEPRRKTLVRLNKLYERTMKYNFRVKDNMEPYHELWPIPQTAIDANTGAKLLQNPGYPGAAE